MNVSHQLHIMKLKFIWFNVLTIYDYTIQMSNKTQHWFFNYTEEYYLEIVNYLLIKLKKLMNERCLIWFCSKQGRTQGGWQQGRVSTLCDCSVSPPLWVQSAPFAKIDACASEQGFGRKFWHLTCFRDVSSVIPLNIPSKFLWNHRSEVLRALKVYNQIPLVFPG